MLYLATCSDLWLGCPCPLGLVVTVPVYLLGLVGKLSVYLLGLVVKASVYLLGLSHEGVRDPPRRWNASAWA